MGSTVLFLLLWLAAGADDLSGLGDGKPVLPPELAALKPGMSEAALVAKVGGVKECYGLGLQVGKWCMVPFWDAHDGYARPALFLPSLAKARSGLTRRWGPPVVYLKLWYWVNPEARLRAALRDSDDPVQLDLETYQPLAGFLGEGQKLPLEKIPLLGATKAALEKAFAGRKQLSEGDSFSVFFPPCEVGGELLLSTELKQGKVTKAWFDLPVGDDPARRELVLGLLEKKWGKRQLVEGEKKDWRFPQRSDVLVYQLGNDLTVRLEKP
jgi:hypothetical protein